MNRLLRFWTLHSASIGLGVFFAVSLALTATRDWRHSPVPETSWFGDLLPETTGFFGGAFLTTTWIDRATVKARRARWREVEIHAITQSTLDALGVFDAMTYEFTADTSLLALRFPASVDGARRLDELSAALVADLDAALNRLRRIVDAVDVLVRWWVDAGKEPTEDVPLDVRTRRATAYAGVDAYTTHDTLDTALDVFLSSRSLSLLVDVAADPRLSLAALETLNAAEGFASAWRGAVWVIPEYDPRWTDRTELRAAAELALRHDAALDYAAFDAVDRYLALLVDTQLLGSRISRLVRELGITASPLISSEETRDFWRRERGARLRN